MKVEWDEEKRRRNLEKHGFDFADAPIVFQGPVIIYEDDRFDYDEDRLIAVGFLRGRIVAIVYVERNGDLRIISMRKANRYEQKQLFQSL